MQFDYAILAEYCGFADDGRLNVAGAHNVLSFNSLPGVVPRAYLAVRLTLDAGDRNRDLTFELSATRQGAEGVLSIHKGTAHIGDIPDGAVGWVHHIARLEGIRFEAAGLYVLMVAVNGAKVHEIRLPVGLIPKPDSK